MLAFPGHLTPENLLYFQVLRYGARMDVDRRESSVEVAGELAASGAGVDDAGQQGSTQDSHQSTQQAESIPAPSGSPEWLKRIRMSQARAAVSKRNPDGTSRVSAAVMERRKSIARLFMAGRSKLSIAKELKIHANTVSAYLNSPAGVEELARLRKMMDVETLSLPGKLEKAREDVVDFLYKVMRDETLRVPDRISAGKELYSIAKAEGAGRASRTLMGAAETREKMTSLTENVTAPFLASTRDEHGVPDVDRAFRELTAGDGCVGVGDGVVPEPESVEPESADDATTNNAHDIVEGDIVEGDE